MPEKKPPAGPPLFDVYIVGGEALAATAQMKVATLIATRYRVPAVTVADGLSGGQCLVGKSLPEPAAKRLADELRDLGAEAQLQAAGLPLRITTKRPAARLPRPERGTSIETDAALTPPLEIVQIGDRVETSVRERPVAPARVDPREDLVRCPIHGLYYDRRKASGCTRCLAPAREIARKLQRPEGMIPGLREHAVRRAFMGVGFALLLGFLPAAYYARVVNAREVRELRARQTELAGQPGTKAVTDEFDALDAAVSEARSRGAKRTFLLWVAVSGIAGLAWYKLA